MPVISAGLAGGGKDTVPAQTWLADMYDADAKGHMDGIGLHLYPGPRGGPVVFDVQEHLLAPVRSVIAKNKDTATPLWITEFGIPTDGDGSTFYRQSEDDQANMLGAVTADLLCAPDIETLLVWRFRDGPTPDGESTMGMGVRREDLSAKPALGAVKTAVQNAATTPCLNPTLTIAADQPLPLKVGQTVNLTVSGMPAGATSFTWDLTGRGYFGTKTDGPTLARAFPKAGHYKPAVHVSDGLHVWSAAFDLDVGTTSKPTAVIVSSPGAKAAAGPRPVLRIRQWQTVVFDSRQSHADSLTNIKQVTWHVQRAPRAKDWRNHAQVLRYAWRKAGTMRIGLEVRDKHGATNITWMKVIVKKACRPGAKHCGKAKRKKTRA
jgi:hypothetical protein